MPSRLSSMSLRGFKTIREMEGFEPGPLAVLIGPNGVGKSNFISFFRMLSWAVASPPNLQQYVQQYGPASALLHDGPERTSAIEAELTVDTDQGSNQYAFRLAYAAGDTLIYTDERFRFTRTDFAPYRWNELGAGHREANLVERAAEADQTAACARVVVALLRRINVHQFHNTSATARIRTKWDAADGRWLKEDAANLAPFLYRLKNGQPEYYQRIVETTRLILPFFADYELEPEHGRLLLSWRERGSDRVFNVSQAADGMLRAMALVALLQQPEADLPDVLILDEPELGLHPYAINVLAGLIQSASVHVQVIVATQSASLVDRFDPEDVVVVDRQDRESVFRRLDPHGLEEWLESYTLSELWEKNVIGGRPG